MELIDIHHHPSTIHITAYQKLIWIGIFLSIHALALNHSYKFFSLTHEQPSLQHLNHSSFIETIWYAQCVCVCVSFCMLLLEVDSHFIITWDLARVHWACQSVFIHCYLTISFVPFNLIVGFHVYQSLKPSILKLFECSHICVAFLMFGQMQMLLSECPQGFMICMNKMCHPPHCRGTCYASTLFWQSH